MDKLRRALSGQVPLEEEEEERGIVGQMMDSSTLSWSTRIKGFVACFALGFLFSVLSTFLMFLPGGLTIFVVLYTLGNVMALGSTCFLMGPMKQLEKMFSSTRVVATIVMLLTLVLTFVCVFVLGNKTLALLMVIIQFLAMTWYSLSYIPYARNAAKSCFESCIG